MSDNKCCKKTTIGGQALIEGIMMLGPERGAIAVRNPEGEIVLKTEDRPRPSEKRKILSFPFIRGVVGLADSLKRGFAALEYSSSIAMEGEEEESKFEKWLTKKFGSGAVEKIVLGIAMVLGVGLSVGLFIFLPTILAGLLERFIHGNIMRNLLEGGFRIIIFLAYMFAISQMKDMKRVFAYHGAEHKTIFCYEAGCELTVENVRKFSKEHPRCGTSFMFSVMIISILVFSVVSWSNMYIRLALRLVLLPVVMGISYEVNRLLGRYDNWFTRFFRAPGVWFQKFTTFEPEDDMIEVAITALSEVIPEDKESDKW